MSDDAPKTFEELIVSLSKTPDAVVRLVTDLSSRAVISKPSPDEFSVLESVCHLRDVEIEGYAARIRRILNEERPSLPDIDGSRLAIEGDYNRQNVADAVESFTQARKENVVVLSEVDDEQLKRTGSLEGVGEITLGKLLMLMWEHDQGHLEEIQRISRKERTDSLQ